MPPKRRKSRESDANPRRAGKPKKNGHSKRAKQYEALRREKQKREDLEIMLEEARSEGYQEGFVDGEAHAEEKFGTPEERRGEASSSRLRRRYDGEWKADLERDFQKKPGQLTTKEDKWAVMKVLTSLLRGSECESLTDLFSRGAYAVGHSKKVVSH